MGRISEGTDGRLSAIVDQVRTVTALVQIRDAAQLLLDRMGPDVFAGDPECRRLSHQNTERAGAIAPVSLHAGLPDNEF